MNPARVGGVGALAVVRRARCGLAGLPKIESCSGGLYEVARGRSEHELGRFVDTVAVAIERPVAAAAWGKDP